jgi:hypothetical protein
VAEVYSSWPPERPIWRLPDMMDSTQPREGLLVDLGPDGLGFVIPVDDPSIKIAFSLRRIGRSTFEEAGLFEGAEVTFRVDGGGKIDLVKPLAVPWSSASQRRQH